MYYILEIEKKKEVHTIHDMSLFVNNREFEWPVNFSKNIPDEK